MRRQFTDQPLPMPLLLTRITTSAAGRIADHADRDDKPIFAMRRGLITIARAAAYSAYIYGARRHFLHFAERYGHAARLVGADGAIDGAATAFRRDYQYRNMARVVQRKCSKRILKPFLFSRLFRYFYDNDV